MLDSTLKSSPRKGQLASLHAHQHTVTHLMVFEASLRSDTTFDNAYERRVKSSPYRATPYLHRNNESQAEAYF
jgi:hypothetical protein